MNFDSTWEEEYAERLEYLRRAGQIRSWRRIEHKTKDFPLEVNGCHIAYIQPDFMVMTNSGVIQAHEVKAMGGPVWWARSIDVWKLKRKMFEALHPRMPYLVFTKRAGQWVPWGKTKRRVSR